MQGYIKLHRKVQDHWLYQEKRTFSKYEAWVDMLMTANHKDNKVLLGSELIQIERGQFITSVRKLGERWKWSNTKVTKFLDLLKQDGMIDYKKDTKKTVITIENYGVYHDSEQQKKTPKEHEKDTETTREHTDKNDKECSKNEEEINYIFELYISKDIIQHKRLSKDIKNAIKKALKKFTREEIEQAINNYSVVYKSGDYWFTYKYTLIDLLRDKDIRKFVDEAEPLNNFSKGKQPQGNSKKNINWEDL